MKPKKKPAKRHDYLIGTAAEARASSALDGPTESCGACQHSYPPLTHTCSLRPMTACEREFIEAWVADHQNVQGWAARWWKAEEALRAERERSKR